MSNASDYGTLYESARAQRPVADPSRYPRFGAYVQVPDHVAQKHPLHGVAGWLVVLAVLMILDAMFGVLVVLGSFILAAQRASGGFFLVGLIQLGMVALMIVCIVKLFQKDAGFPRLFTLSCIASVTLTAIGILIGGLTWMAVVQLAVVAVYVGYVQLSQRVDVTYRHLILSGDYLFELIGRESAAGTATTRTAGAA